MSLIQLIVQFITLLTVHKVTAKLQAKNLPHSGLFTYCIKRMRSSA